MFDNLYQYIVTYAICELIQKKCSDMYDFTIFQINYNLLKNKHIKINILNFIISIIK